MVTCLALLLAAMPDVPRAIVMPDVSSGVLQAEADTSLADARRLADQQRYEEAVVEYQRYLGALDRPAKERAAALFELGFLHLVLGDEVNAEVRALEAMELDGKLKPAATAAPKQVEFFNRMHKRFLARARLEVLDRQGDDAPQVVRVGVVDPEGNVKRVLLRHSLTQAGPFLSSDMVCTGGQCQGAIPGPGEGVSFTAFYFVEALDEKQASLAKTGSADAPLQLAVVAQKAWYKSPWVWGISGAVIVAVGAVVFLVSPPPPMAATTTR